MTTYSLGYKKTWNVPDTGTVIQVSYQTFSQEILWAIKDRLVNAELGAWSVVASSGKAGGGSLVADTNDNWLSSADLVRGTTSGSARSWVLLKSPTVSAFSPYYMLMDYWSVTTYNKFHVYFTRDMPDISSPSTTARPPVTGDEWSYLEEYIHSSYGSTGVQCVVTYLWLAHDGSFVFETLMPLIPDSTWARGQHSYFVFNVMRKNTLKSWDTVGAASMRLTGLGQPPGANFSLPFKTLHNDGGVITQTTLTPIVPGFHYEAISRDFIRCIHTDFRTGRWPSMPVWMVDINSGKVCRRGLLEDLWFTSSCLLEGQPIFAGNVVAATKVGPFLVPSPVAMRMI